MFLGWIKYYYVDFQMMAFLIPLFLVHLLFSNLLHKKLSPLPIYSFIYLFIWLWTHRFTFYLFSCLSSITIVMYFDAQIVPIGVLSSWLCPFDISRSFFKQFFTFWHNKLILYFPSHSPGMGHFSKELWILSVENLFRK